ncbi:MAG: histidine phosphatase family protein [Desulfobacteraceae bacterium]|jgi:broad specificity phosphatase PhoE|nr:histidine phosphatase family protein [Desulfobacteraceae bacterium]
MGEFFFFRHGQGSFGTGNYDRLSERGVLQAMILGQHLATCHIHFDAVYSGSLERQKDTARRVREAYLEKDLFFPELLVDESWNEMDSNLVWEAQIRRMMRNEPGLLDDIKMDPGDKKAFQKIFSRVMDRWVSGDFDGPGDLTWKGFQQQVRQGLNALCETTGPSGKIAVFSSGGPICVAVQAALDLSGPKTLDLLWQLMNASITRFKWDGQRISLSGFNEITHLALKGDKTLITYR